MMLDGEDERPRFLWGRYVKLCNDMPQSPWLIGDARKGKSSVHEVIADGVARAGAAARAEGVKFHAAGREDIDVRMLGNGRPFMLDLGADGGARASAEDGGAPPKPLRDVEAEINARRGLNGDGDVAVTSLRAATKAEWAGLQASTEERRKRYRCVVWAASPIGAADVARLERLCDVPLAQRTPVRVLHRRASLTRAKTLHALRVVRRFGAGEAGAEAGAARWALLELVCSAGMYVKEFCHGDLGRTTPSLASLLGRAVDILQLDVVGLEEDEDAGGGAADGAKRPADDASADDADRGAKRARADNA